MKTLVENDQVSIDLLVEDSSHTFSPLEFIVDTGFTGTLFFTVNSSWDIFKIFECTDVQLMKKHDWVIFANGKSEKTFSGTMTIRMNNKNIPNPVLICSP